MYRQPQKFKANNGEVFDIQIVKFNKRTLIIELIKDNKKIKQVKISKTSKKLIY